MINPGTSIDLYLSTKVVAAPSEPATDDQKEKDE
jgi:hypothetical protein